jgi:tetratricopeptide (TPR) repeat protein
MARQDWGQALRCATVATEADPADYEAHKLRALAHDRQGNLGEAFSAYETALSLKPDGLDLLVPLAQLAFRLNQMELSATFYQMALAHSPDDLSIIDGCAISLRELGRFDEAMGLCQNALSGDVGQKPEAAVLWTTLGTIMSALGDHETALIFLRQSLDLKDSPPARFHLGCSLMELGRFAEAIPVLEACLDAFRDPDNRASVAITHAQALLASGQIEAGWQAYVRVREKTGSFNELFYDLKVPRLEPKTIGGQNILLVAEQGLGDEVLFSTLIPDILRVFGPASVTLSVEPRLVALMQRSYPLLKLTAHYTSTQMGRLTRRFDEVVGVSGFALLGDFLPALRSRLSDFDAPLPPLTADPSRVAHWRSWLEGLGPARKIGLTWKSLKADVNRDRFYAPFTAWEPLLRSDAQIISVQYGDISAEKAWAQAQGLSIIEPPGLNALTQLDDLAALCRALDGVAGPSNATTNIAAACRVPTHIYAPFPAWIFLGQDRHPFYPSARLHLSEPPGRPADAVARLITSLG